MIVDSIKPRLGNLTMTQLPSDKAELLELLKLAKIGEEKARRLYELNLH